MSPNESCSHVIPVRQRLSGEHYIRRVKELEQQGFHIESVEMGSNNGEWVVKFYQPALFVDQPQETDQEQRALL